MKKILILIFLLGVFNQASGIRYQPLHEAFIAPVSDITTQEVVETPPPKAKAEIAPKQPNNQTVWIPGYWTLDRQTEKFVWICGVWRVPPPDHSWLRGNWIEVDSGWTWVRGFWIETKNQTISNIIHTKIPAPATQNEATGEPPGSDYFWSMGYWNFNQTLGKFQWLSGSWQKFNPKWIFIAAHWIWRPEGYIFIPAYWDWKLEDRGVAFDCIEQDPLSPQSLIQALTPYYPDYKAECAYYYYSQPLFWSDCDCLPPWWSWSDWWSLPWSESWWLWWWYGHDGYPCPPLALDILDLLPPPKDSVAKNFKQFPAPLFITPFGVPNIDEWLDAIEDAIGSADSMNPFFPPNQRASIFTKLRAIMPETGKQRPAGKPGNTWVKKPHDINLVEAAGEAVIPAIPTQAAPPASRIRHARQTLNIPSVQFMAEPAYNPNLRAYPTPVYIPPYYKRDRDYEGWQNWDSEGRRRGAYHKGHHKGHQGGGGHKGRGPIK